MIKHIFDGSAILMIVIIVFNLTEVIEFYDNTAGNNIGMVLSTLGLIYLWDQCDG